MSLTVTQSRGIIVVQSLAAVWRQDTYGEEPMTAFYRKPGMLENFHYDVDVIVTVHVEASSLEVARLVAALVVDEGLNHQGARHESAIIHEVRHAE